MSELWRVGASELARRIRRREVSSRDVVEAHLARIDAVNGRLNAVTVVLREEALRAADAADRALRAGAPVGPLCGVPVTIKENLDVAGSATTLGIVPLRNAVARGDAPVVAELRDAGAIPLGRTNMPEFGMRWHTDNALYGATRNPWSAERTPGGSSGGEAAAVAAGMSPLGIGNDGAGSLRWPAQCCGVVALKPSLGRVSLAGASPGPIPFAFQLLAVHGPLAREVRDLRLALAHMCGRAGGDPWHAPVPLAGPPPPKPLRISLVSGWPGVDVDPAIAEALRRAAALLEDAGYIVAPSDAPELARASELYRQLMSSYSRVTQTQAPVEAVASPAFARFWELYEPIWSGAAGKPAFDPMLERAAIARAWSDWMERAPLVLAPICTRSAFRVGADLDPAWLAGWPAALRTIVVVNLLGLPSVAVPVGEADGLPQVVQVIGPRFREDLCLDAAEAIESRTERLTPIDPR
jgi:amidase